MHWIYLIIAGMLEWGWPVGLKYALPGDGIRWVPALIAIAFMTGSGAFLMLAQKEIPMGTAYAVWTGIGAVGAFAIGILHFNEPATFARYFFVSLIIIGIIGLKFSTK